MTRDSSSSDRNCSSTIYQNTIYCFLRTDTKCFSCFSFSSIEIYSKICHPGSYIDRYSLRSVKYSFGSVIYTSYCQMHNISTWLWKRMVDNHSSSDSYLFSFIIFIIPKIIIIGYRISRRIKRSSCIEGYIMRGGSFFW